MAAPQRSSVSKMLILVHGEEKYVYAIPVDRGAGRVLSQFANSIMGPCERGVQSGAPTRAEESQQFFHSFPQTAFDFDDFLRIFLFVGGGFQDFLRDKYGKRFFGLLPVRKRTIQVSLAGMEVPFAVLAAQPLTSERKVSLLTATIQTHSTLLIAL